MDRNGVIRRVIEPDETEEDIALEVRRLAQRIYQALNPELFPPEDAESNPTQRTIDSLPLLDPPAGHVTVLSRRRIGVPGPPSEPKPRPPAPPPSRRVKAPPLLPPRYSNAPLPSVVEDPSSEAETMNQSHGTGNARGLAGNDSATNHP